MPCYYPITAFQANPGEPLLFAAPQWGATQRGGAYHKMQIACGQCHGCRLKRSRHWAMRCLHEKQMHKYSSFITLTLDDEHLEDSYSLDYALWQRFMRRTRNMLGRKSNQHRFLHHGRARDVRFYMAGEYGEKFSRPHFHAILFGLDFADKTYQAKTPAGSKIYTSETLQKLWPLGFSSIGDVTFESAAYVARYIMKKRTGDGNKENTEIIDLETGEIKIRKKEFNQMSRRPGIGSTWLAKYGKTDVYTTGKVIVRGHPQYPPRYYDKLQKKIDAAALEDFQYARYVEALAQHEHHSPERLAVQETVAKAKTSSLKRNLN